MGIDAPVIEVLLDKNYGVDLRTADVLTPLAHAYLNHWINQRIVSRFMGCILSPDLVTVIQVQLDTALVRLVRSGRVWLNRTKIPNEWDVHMTPEEEAAWRLGADISR